MLDVLPISLSAAEFHAKVTDPPFNLKLVGSSSVLVACRPMPQSVQATDKKIRDGLGTSSGGRVLTVCSFHGALALCMDARHTPTRHGRDARVGCVRFQIAQLKAPFLLERFHCRRSTRVLNVAGVRHGHLP